MNEYEQQPVEEAAAAIVDPSAVGGEQASAEARPRVVVGVDGSESSIAALRSGIRVATVLGATLEAVGVWHHPSTYGGPAIVTDWSPQTDTEGVLIAAAREVFDGEIPEWFHPVMAEGSAARALIEQSKGAEMVIVGSRGHGGFAGLLLGSVSAAVAEYAHCPVLIYHEPHKEKSGK